MVRGKNGLKNLGQFKLRFRKMSSDALRPKVNFNKKIYSNSKKLYPLSKRLNPKEVRFGKWYVKDIYDAKRFSFNNTKKSSLIYLDFLENLNKKYKLSVHEIPKDLNSFGGSLKSFLNYFEKTYGAFNRAKVLSLEEKVVFKLFNSVFKKYDEIQNNFVKLLEANDYIKDLNKSRHIDFKEQRQKIIEEAAKEIKHSQSLERISSKEENYQQDRQKSIIQERNSKLDAIDKRSKNYRSEIESVKKKKKN